MDILSYLYPIFLLFGMFDPLVGTQPMQEPIFVIQEAKTHGEYIGEYYTTGYYAPLGDQTRYFDGRTYEQDKTMNCGKDGDCFTTANGYKLSAKDELSIVACPRTFDFGTRLIIEGLGEVVCQDRGGSIKGRRLDIWNGIGQHGLENIERGAFRDGKYKVYLVK